jgi:predicted Zn-dependent protease
VENKVGMEVIKYFERAISQFEDNSLKVFYAMTLYNMGQHSDSMEILLKLFANTSDDKTIKSYSKSIEFYSDKLNILFK